MPPKKKTARQLDHEIAQALGHSTRKTASTTARWIHRDVARSQGVPEDVVRRIYAAVQTAKRQGLYGGHAADLVERSVGRKLVGNEYTVAARAKDHLGYDPPGGYGGPKPTGSAKEPPRVRLEGPKAESALQIAARAEAVVKDVLRRRKHPTFGWDTSNDSKDRALLRQAADDLDVAADIFEEAGAGIRAGTLHERARHARQGTYGLLDTYGHATKKSSLIRAGAHSTIKTAKRLTKAQIKKLGIELRKAIKIEQEDAEHHHRYMKHDDYERAAEVAIRAAGLQGQAAAQPGDEGVEVWEVVPGEGAVGDQIAEWHERHEP